MSYGRVIQIGNIFKIEFRPIPKILAAVKELPQRKWDHQRKFWSVPAQYHKEVIEFCQKYQIAFGAEPEKNEQEYVIDPLPELTIDIPLSRPLFPFQKNGVAYTMDRKRLIMGDDMGMGKTTQAIAALHGLKVTGHDVYPALVICPSSVKINWQRELMTVAAIKALVLNNSIKNTFPEFYRAGLANVFIVNYESLQKFFVEKIDDPGKDKNGRALPLRLNHFHFKKKYIEFFKTIIADEAHRLKSLSTKQTKITKALSIDKQHIFLLTGTPVINKPKDLISQLGILGQLGKFGGYSHFVNHFCGGIREASNLNELNYLLNKYCFYRRNKTDKNIINDLPDKMRQVVICELSPAARKEYQHALNDLESYMKEFKNASDNEVKKSMKGEVMVRIGILKDISARGKLHDVFEFIHDTISNGQKLVVFANLTEIINKVQEKFPKSVRITGQENDLQKQANIDRFQNDPEMKLIVCNLKAAGVGVTLTASSNVCFIEQGWHAAIMDQAEDRCFRIGQKNNVMCTYFLGEDTIDENIYQLIQSKREIANAISGAVDEFETSIVDNIINLFSA